MAEIAFESLSERWRGVPWAVIDDGTVYGRTLADEFRARMEEAGSAAASLTISGPPSRRRPGWSDRLQRAGASAAFVAGDAEDVAILWSNVKDFDSKVEIRRRRSRWRRCNGRPCPAGAGRSAG